MLFSWSFLIYHHRKEKEWSVLKLLITTVSFLFQFQQKEEKFSFSNSGDKSFNFTFKMKKRKKKLKNNFCKLNNEIFVCHKKAFVGTTKRKMMPRATHIHNMWKMTKEVEIMMTWQLTRTDFLSLIYQTRPDYHSFNYHFHLTGSSFVRGSQKMIKSFYEMAFYKFICGWVEMTLESSRK